MSALGDIASFRLSSKFAETLEQTATFLHSCHFPCLASCENALNELVKNTQRPFNVAVFGRMKTGKSSLINALIGAPLAITGTEEATATINLITYSEDPQMLDKFTVHWVGRPAETFPLSSLQKDWTGKTEEVKARVRQTRYIQLYSNYSSLKLHEVIDTPGTGSDVTEHENAAKSILDCFAELSNRNGMHSDALIYVFPPVGRENDEEALQTFRSGCVPESTPYNSVGVLHKWDHIYWENGGDIADIQKKADTLKKAMDGMLADVFPVSAPLAFASRHLPDLFYSKIQDIINSRDADSVMRALSRDERWDRDEQCGMVRQLSADILPWASFQILVREYLRHPELAISEFRNHILSLSGLPLLRAYLDRNFFAMGAIIRQKQNIAKLEKVRRTAIAALDNEKKSVIREAVYWDELYAQNNLNLKMRGWIADKRANNLDEEKNIQKAMITIDKKFIDGEIGQTVADMDSLKWSQNEGFNLFDSREHDMIQQIFNHFCDLSPQSEAPLKNQLEEFAGKLYVLSMFYPDRMTRAYSHHIYLRAAELGKICYYAAAEGGRG